MVHRYLRLIGGVAIALGAANVIWPALPLWVVYVLLFTGAGLILFETPGIFRDINKAIGRLPIRGAIRWDFRGFLGANWRQGEAVYVTVFQTNGENISRRPIEILDAKIQSSITGEQINVTFKTNGGYTEAENLNPVPQGAKFNAHALFYDPSAQQPGEREGLPEDMFLKNWGDFEFNVRTRRRHYRRRFSNKEIIKQIARVKPPSVATRRISRKDASRQEQRTGNLSFIKFNPRNNELIDAGGSVMYWDDNGTGDYGVGFDPPLDKNELICIPVGETPRDFEIISFTPDYINIKFKSDPEIVHLRFGH